LKKGIEGGNWQRKVAEELMMAENINNQQKCSRNAELIPVS
jgi:hypothetical protein